jgi:hypothetical protein
MADPVSTLLNILVEQGSPGVVGLIGGVLIYKKFFSGKDNPPVQKIKYITKDLCDERGRRVGDDIERLENNDRIHFEAQKENLQVLHKLDNHLARLMEHHKIKTEEQP